MGKYSKGMRAWSEKQLAQFICQVFDEEIKRYTGPQGPPGPMGMQGPPGAPGYCRCASQLPLAPWQTPIVTYDTNSTALPVQQYLYSYSQCGCQWTGSADQDAPEFCQHGSSLIRKETL